MISVLTLTYKRPHLLEEAIQSFLEQQIEEPSEMVVINDNSEVNYILDHPRVRIINHKTRFSSIATKLEWGYKQCKFKYIYRLDDDDLLGPEGLNNTIQDIKNNPGFEIYRASGMYFFVNNAYERINSNVNNGNVYTKEYLDRITFPDKSIGEDSDITFSNNATIYESELTPTMCYRWGMNTLHVSGMGEVTNKQVQDQADAVLSNDVGDIQLNPQFLSNYYEQIGAGETDRLTSLANKHGTDKGTLESVWGHGYTTKYHELFSPLNAKHVRMLEIGIMDPRFPGACMKMWNEYFNDLYFVGFDNNPEAKKFAGERMHVFIGDQNNPEDLNRCVNMFGGDWNIIIDDGSHRGEHILTSFEHLWPYVKQGGYYIIEDLHSAFAHADTTLPALSAIIANNNWIVSKRAEYGGKMLILQKL